ncbi:MAG: hypothetical protein ACRC7H_04640 [Plesiomonas shigelloides]
MHCIADVISDGDETLSDESDQEQVDDDAISGTRCTFTSLCVWIQNVFKYLTNLLDCISAVPRSAVETSSDEEETLSDKSNQEELDDHIDEDALSGW